MSAGCPESPVKCSILSIPTGYFQSKPNFETIQMNNEQIIVGLGSNTLVINEHIAVKIGINNRLKSNISWAVLKFNLVFYNSTQENAICTSNRLVQIVIDDKVSGDTVVLSEDLLFNLDSNSTQRSLDGISPKFNKLFLQLMNKNVDQSIVPGKATKVVLSLYQTEIHLEESLIDKLLKMYFSYPKYLCNNDVFGVYLDEAHNLDLINNAKVDTIYFKVCELQGLHNSVINSERSEITLGHFVDSSVPMYQLSNHQGFLPSRKVPLCYKPNLYSLLSDGEFIKQMERQNQNLLPSSFDEIFNTICQWVEPFFYKSKSVQDVKLNATFLISGQNGSGKTLLLQAVSQYFGTSYWRVDCVTVAGTIPGQSEAKIKAIFTKIKSIAPCILHLSNIEALCQDADFKDDIRVKSCFEQQVKMSTFKWPVVIMATTHNNTCSSCNINHLFLDSSNINAPNYEQRQDTISWLIHQNSGSAVDTDILQTAASQTSGFVYRDLQTLVALAFKERYKRSKEENDKDVKFIMSDFSKIIGAMHKAYSDSIGAPKVPSVSWKDVGGLEHLKKEILRSLRSNMFNTGLKRSGLLLHGPPGTGKTLLAKAVATQCGRNFLSVKGPELLNMYVGQSEHNVRDLFELAKVASPSIIFFDELDSLAPNRGRSGDSGGVMDRVVSQLLAEMDDLSNSGDVFILGATNRPDLIDPALLRPGRLDKLLYVGPCKDHSSQLSVLTALTRKLFLGSDVNLQEIVSLLPDSVSGAQLSALCSAAWLTSTRQLIQSGEHKPTTTFPVNRDHFISALGAVFNEQQ